MFDADLNRQYLSLRQASSITQLSHARFVVPSPTGTFTRIAWGA